MRDSRRLFRHVLLILTCVLAAAALPAAADSIAWKNIGPGGGGNIRFHAVSPEDPNIILAGADVGGIYRSADAGLTWKLVNDGIVAPDGGTNYQIYNGFAFDPTNAQVVYTGPFKSTDSGQHWLRISDEFTFGGALVDPTSHPTGKGTVYIFQYGSVYKSTCGWDGSCTRTVTCPLGQCGMVINSMVLDPANTSHLIACSEGTGGGLYKSDDGAATWVKMPNPGPDPEYSTLGCNRIVYHQASGKLFVVLDTEGPANGILTETVGWKGGVFVKDSWNSLMPWTDISGPAAAPSNLITNGGFESPSSPPCPTPGPPSNWALTGDVTRVCDVFHTGSMAMKLDFTTSQTARLTVSPRIAVQGGHLYRLSGWFKTTAAATGFPANAKITAFQASEPNGTLVNWLDRGFPTLEPWNATNWGDTNWRRFETLIQPTAAMGSFEIQFHGSGGDGTTWVDDVALEEWNGLPHVSGVGASPSFVSFSSIAVHPNRADIIYAGTKKGSFSNFESDIGGIWRTTNGGQTWKNVTRSFDHDNVLDSIGSWSACGDGVCGGKTAAPVQGRYEDCTTCPFDCAAVPCCGDGIWQPGETQGNCLIDCYRGASCLLSAAEPGRPYYEALYSVDALNVTHGSSALLRGMQFIVWNIATSCPTVPCTCMNETCLRVYWGGEHMRSINGGDLWEDFISTGVTPPQVPVVAWTARGDTTDTYAYRVVTDARDANRVYYADKDNLLQVSLDGGSSFTMEGWQWGRPPTTGLEGGAGNVVLDGSDKNKIYVATSPPPGNPANPSQGGVVVGTYHPSPTDGVPWTWAYLGTAGSLPKGGGIEMIRDASNNFFATVYSKGAYKLTGGSGGWSCLGGGACPGLDSHWTPSIPSGWQTYPLTCVTTQSPPAPPACDTSLHRLYIGAGDIFAPALQTPAETGVWESNDDGDHWCKISDSQMERKPIMTLRPNGPNTLYAGTWDPRVSFPSPTATWDGDGGIYRGTRSGDCTWTWQPVLAQPRVTSIVVSPVNSSILYAVSAQMYGKTVINGQAAGIYKSVNNGVNGSWNLLPNTGLMCLRDVRLDFSAIDGHKLYASTEGSGVFEGTICGPLAEGFPDTDGDTVVDCADTDDDNDLVLDTADNCPLVANANQFDCNDNGIGDACGDLCTNTYCSVAGDDGWTSRKNNTFTPNPGNELITGDASNKLGYRSILSFNTEPLDDNATILAASVAVTPTTVLGTVGSGMFATLIVDIRTGSFGSAGLQGNDYEAAASGDPLAATLPFPTVIGDTTTRTVALSGTELTRINKFGVTEFRLRFNGEFDNDSVSDQVKWKAGELTPCPLLTVQYTAP